jgi:hypothetical protein
MRITFKVLRNTRGKDWHPGCKNLKSERKIGKTARKITNVMKPGVCFDNSLGTLITNPE